MSFQTNLNVLAERPKPKIWLAKPDQTIITRLNGVENLNGNFNYMNQDDITFDINSYIYDEFKNEQYKNEALQLIRNKYLLKFVYLDQEKWFVIDDKSDISDEKEHMSITARYIGSELDKKWIGDIEEIGYTISQLFTKYLPIVAPSWRVRNIDDSLKNVKREYNTSDASVSSLIEMACELTDAVVIFHNKEREFSFVHRDNAGKFRGLHAKEATYLKSFTDKSDSKDLTTRLVLFGKEGLTINGINPSGSSYIENFSYYMAPFKRDSNRKVISHSDYMSDELCHAMLDFEEYYNNKKDEYENINGDYSALLTEQLEEDFKLEEITGNLRRIEERIELLKPQGNYFESTVRSNRSYELEYNTHYYMVIYNQGSLARITFNGETEYISPNEHHYIKIKTPEKVNVDDPQIVKTLEVLSSNTNLNVALSTSTQDDYDEENMEEIDKKYNRIKYQMLYDNQVQIVAAVERRMKGYENQRDSIQDSLSAQRFFAPHLLKERQNFEHWGVFRDENYTDPKKLLEDGARHLEDSNNVIRSTEVSLIDFLQSLDPEDIANRDKLIAGEKIRFSSKTYEKQYEAFISELKINFDENDISLTLSDVIDLKDRSKSIAQQLAGFVSASNKVDLGAKTAEDALNASNKVMALLESEWDANKRRILAGNETVDIGSHGIKITSPTHPNEMLIAVAGLIAISNDNGETFKQAINTRGVVAERLIGKILIGTELVLENNSGTFRFDDNGVRINASSFHLIADDGEDYFESLLRKLENEFLTVEERIKEESANQEKSLQKEINDVTDSLTNYTSELLNALADGILTEQEIKSLQMQLYMLEADYGQVRRRAIPLMQDNNLNADLQERMYTSFIDFEVDYHKLRDFIQQLDAPTKIPQATIDEIVSLVKRFKPSIEELIDLIEQGFRNIEEQRVANAEYNSREFAENLMHDMDDEIKDLSDSLKGLNENITSALSDGIITTVEKSQLSDALMRLESEKQDVDNRFALTYNHRNLEGKSEKSSLQSAKATYNSRFNALVTKVNQIMNLEKVSYDIVEEYKELFKEFSTALSQYSVAYERALDAISKGYADDAEGEAKRYTDALQMEVSADIKDINDNVKEFEADVYGAFKDGIITEQERNRLSIHHNMLEKEKSDLIERYNTIVTSQDLLGHWDVERLIATRQAYGQVHADLLLALELAMMDSKITKEESEQAMRLFNQYVERLADFSVQLELAIAALGEVKAINYTNEQLDDYISQSVFNDEIAQMQATLDGHIMTWYYNHTPTLNNIPASDWKDEKTRTMHIGDLFYNADTGSAYRFLKEGNVYKWVTIKDTDVVKALEDAKDALDLADKKRRVFVTTPTPPYDVGDLWIQADGELMRARTKKGQGATFQDTDWIVATKYTDDTRANQIGNQLENYRVSNNREIADLKESLGAFRDTIETAFKDGIIEEYELKILQTNIQSLNREKADVDAGYYQLLNHPHLTGQPKTKLQNAYANFNSVHNNLVSTINQVIADGKITEKEYEDTMKALDAYPTALVAYKNVMNEVYLHLIKMAQDKANDAMIEAQRFETWKSSSFEVDTEKIASRVGESSWETKWLPKVESDINAISVGGVNLVNWTEVNTANRDKLPVLRANNDITIVSQQEERFFQVRQISSSDDGATLSTYVGRRTPNDTNYFSIEKGQTYTLTLRGAYSSTVDPFSYMYIMRDDNMENPNSGTSGSNQGVSRALVDRENVETGYGSRYTFTFTANWSSRKAYVLVGTHKKAGFPDGTSFWFRFKELQLEKGNKATDYSLSQSDRDAKVTGAVDNYHNTVIKQEYSTTNQTKNMISSEVGKIDMSGELSKVSSGLVTYDINKNGNGYTQNLREINGSLLDDAFSYELAARTQEQDDSLFVVILNSRGKGKGWEISEPLERKGSTGRHPMVSITPQANPISNPGTPIVWFYGATTLSGTIDLVYNKYAGSFTNINYTQSQIKQMADSISLRVTERQSARQNLVPYTDFSNLEDRNAWSTWGVNVTKSGQWGNYLLVNSVGENSNIGAVSPNLTLDVSAGRTLTLSFLGALSGTTSEFTYCYLMNRNGSNQALPRPTFERVTHSHTTGGGFSHGLYTITFTPNFTGTAYLLIGATTTGSDPATSWIRIANVKLERGESASSYTPAPEDMSSRFAEIKVTTNAITSEVNKKADNTEIRSLITQTANSINSEVSKKINDTTARSLITQTENRISLSVDNVADKVDGLSSGANMLRNSQPFDENLTFMRGLNGGSTNVAPQISTLDNVQYFLGRESSTSNSSYIALEFGNVGSSNYMRVEQGKTYTLSFIARSSSQINLNYIYLMRTDGANQGSLTLTKTLPSSYENATRYVFTFTANWTSNRTYLLIGGRPTASSSGGQWLRVRDIMFHEGNMIAPYAPHPDEITANNRIISAINMDTSGTMISGDKVSITANDINIDGKTINIGDNIAIRNLRTSVSTAQATAESAEGDAASAQSTANTANTQANAARVGNNIANSLNNSSTSVNINANRINLNGDLTTVSGLMRVNSMDFNRATATGGSGSSTLRLSGDELELRGTYRRSWRGTTKNYDTFTRMKNGHLRFRNNTESRSLYYSDFGISTMVDGDGGGDSSGTLQFFDTEYSTARGVTLESNAGVVALRSNSNRVIIESSRDNFVYVVSPRLRVIRNADMPDSYSDIQFSSAQVNNIRVNDERANLYLGVSTNELRVTNNLFWNGGNTGYRPIRAHSLQTHGSIVLASHSGGNAYIGVGGYELRVTNNNGYNGGNTTWRGLGAATVTYSSLNQRSSENYKRDISKWDLDVLDIMKNELQLYKYKYNDGLDSEGFKGIYHHGVIIEREVPSEWVSGSNDSVNTNEVTFWNTKAIQELAHENDELKDKVSNLENEIQQIKEMLAK